MEEYIAFDSHKRHTRVEHEQVNTGKVRQYRLQYAPGAIRRALAGCEPGTAVALEATANWNWMVGEIEQAGLAPLGTMATKAKERRKSGLMRKWMSLAPFLILASFGTIATAQQPPAEWVDSTTGHRIIRLSNEPGSSSSYFTQNEFTPDGRKLIITTPGGISTVDLQTRAIDRVVEGRVRLIEVGRKTGRIYYMKEGAVYSADVNTRASREIIILPPFRSVSTVNADETLLAGSYVVGGMDSAQQQARERAAPPAPGQRSAAQESMLYRRWSLHLPMALYTIDIKTGQMQDIHHSNEWLNHVQFSPTDPAQLMFCHEGPWHEVDRIWAIRTDGTKLTKVHTRTLEMEIAGHEFWGADGKMIWYDLQTPRGEDFWLAGYSIASGERVWYHLQRDEWSVHFNVSSDGKLFAGDGGDQQMVAHAKDGKWIYLFRPELIPNRESKGRA